MAAVGSSATEPNEITPTHGACTTDDFCEECRELDLGNSKDLGRYRGEIYRDVIDGSTCPFCQFIKMIARVSGATAIFVRNETLKDLPGSILHRVLCLQMYNWGRPLEKRFLLHLAPQPGAYQYGLADINGKLYFPSRPEQPIRYHYPQRTSIDVETMKQYITDCERCHVEVCAERDPGSKSRISTSSDFHLIDCQDRRVIQAHGVPEYVALSYVWGPSEQQDDSQVEAQNEDARDLPQCLPKTIEDAINVTLQLGFRYLWVDKYCIPQSTPHGDLQRQLATMDSIYHCAVVTIIAAFGDSADSGLPGVGSTPRSAPPSIKINDATWVSGVRNTHSVVAKSVWATRGWTYQENHFARRRLIFTDEQVLFECNMCRRNESTPSAISASSDLSTDIFGVGSHDEEISSTIRLTGHIKAFTKRNLTYQSDALKALQGIFTSFSRRQWPVKQLWGIPTGWDGYQNSGASLRDSNLSSILAYGMTWRVLETDSAKRRTGFPSWSWAGWIALIDWFDYDALNRPADFSVLKQDGTSMALTEPIVDSILLENNNPTSIYTYNLRATAEVTQVGFRHVREILGGRSRLGKNDFKYAMFTSAETWQFGWLLYHDFDVENGDDVEEMLCRDVFECVIITSEFGIVVRELNGVHERIGLLELRVRDLYHPASLQRGRLFTPAKGQHLSEVFPGTKKEIVLG